MGDLCDESEDSLWAGYAFVDPILAGDETAGKDGAPGDVCGAGEAGSFPE